MEKLALYGGEKAKKTPYPKGKRFGEEELKELKEAIEQNTLFYWYGNKVKTLTEKFKAMYKVNYCTATSSGTSAIHTALGALGVTSGDEVITTPLTDMGTVIGIICQNAIPVFADIDPYSYNITAETIEKCITDKTRAVIVVHLAGRCADMDSIVKLCKEHNLKLIEDCAQAYLAKYKGKLAGTFGDAGCFSLNDFKQISAGDGGLVIMNDEEVYKNALKFADKNYNRLATTVDEMRAVHFIGPNYRMNELTGAVGIAQLGKVEAICKRRNEIGEKLNNALKDIPCILPPLTDKEDYCTYWFYLFRVDTKKINTDMDTFVNALKAEGGSFAKGYITEPIYSYPLFKELTGYYNSHVPFNLPEYGKEISYPKGLCPVAEDICANTVKMGINEFLTDTDVDELIECIRKVSGYFTEGK